MKRMFLPLLGLGLAAFGSGCTPDIEAVTVTALTTPPLALEASAERIELFDGTGVGLQIFAYTEDPGPQGENTATCEDDCDGQPEPIDPEEVDITFSGDAIDVYLVEDGVYIVAGVKPGEGTLFVSSSEADGTIEIPVTVVPQPD
jgi:hypothetical protein